MDGPRRQRVVQLHLEKDFLPQGPAEKRDKTREEGTGVSIEMAPRAGPDQTGQDPDTFLGRIGGSMWVIMWDLHDFGIRLNVVLSSPMVKTERRSTIFPDPSSWTTIVLSDRRSVLFLIYNKSNVNTRDAELI